MNSYDLDGDGGIGGAELTPAAERAMDEWASDTGRTFASIIGIPLTAISYTIWFAFLFGGEWLMRRILLPKPTAEEQTASIEIEEKQTDDGDPYRPPIVG